MSETSVKYKQSRYNFCEMYEGKMILYSTKTGAVGIIEPDKVMDYQQILSNPDNKEKNPEIALQLLQQGFLVSENTDELAQIKTWHERAMKFPNYIQVTLLPDESCNFNCPYCFIYTHRNIAMNQPTYDAVYKYIEKCCKNAEETMYLTLGWFGGEPLLAIEKIIEFMNRLNTLKERYPLVITANIITNGYLLSYENFVRLVSAGVTGYQVTIDGYPEVHNKLRPLRNGTPTYETIYHNLLEIAQKTKGSDIYYKFAIRVNFLKENQDLLTKFVDKLLEDFGDHKRFKLYFRPIYYFETDRDDINAILDKLCSKEEGIELQNSLEFRVMEKRGEIGDRRLADPLPMPALSWCGTEWYHSFIVGADGSLFFCDTMSDKKQAAGHISEDGDLIIEKGMEVWKGSVFEETDTLANCFPCRLFPICLGGCRRNRVETGKPECFWTEEQIRKSMRDYVTVKHS
ncbi:MAG: SPASM domain-containing protein [Hungatella sp.]|nr:SPASM domain-containing protein [Hungatella sp.]